jgi:prostatic aicd phosphatase
MLLQAVLVTTLVATFVAAQSDSEVVAVLLLGRHGDRTSKIAGIGIEGASVLTTLGENEIFESATYFKNRYLNSSSPEFITNISSNYQIPQVYASAPYNSWKFGIMTFRNDNVLGPSAWGFMQGLFPPDTTATLQTLANGTTETSPLNGYQYVSLNGIPLTAPDIIWIAGDQNCPTMTEASQAYYNSTKFLTMKPELQPFYDKFIPLLEGILPNSSVSFQSAYNVFDYLNVGYIHNTTIYDNLSPDDLFQLRTLADSQSFDLNYNASSPNASIGGKALAGMILTHLNQTVSQSSPSLKLTYFAGAYGVMLAFWGLTSLPAASPDFMGLPDYASAMAFELRRPVGNTGFNNISVRFGFRNGSNPSMDLTYFPMFGQNQIDMPWSDWSQQIFNISILSDAAWCNICKSNLTFCTGSGSTATNPPAQSASSQATATSQSSSGLSNAAAGGIGAGVTIGVIAIVEGLLALCYFGSRKKRNAGKVGSETGSTPSETGSK